MSDLKQTNFFILKLAIMKTLSLIVKSTGNNYFFGICSARGQAVVASFTSAEELQQFLIEKRPV